jgi:hypothetical protein
MAQMPEVFNGADVLEVGSGVGLCGLFAAALGAKTVTLTDCVREVLVTLALSAAANHPHGGDGGGGWDYGHVRVRYLDWDDEEKALESDAREQTTGAAGVDVEVTDVGRCQEATTEERYGPRAWVRPTVWVRAQVKACLPAVLSATRFTLNSQIELWQQGGDGGGDGGREERSSGDGGGEWGQSQVE